MTDDTGITEAEKVTPSGPPPAPEQLHQLDFLLGRFECVFNNVVVDPPTTVVTYWETRKTLNGHYYEMDITMPTGQFSARWIFGWNDVEAGFLSYYYDDIGSQGTSIAPGWQDGHLVFTGQSNYFGHRITNRDDFVIVDENHVLDTSYVLEDGEWELAGTYDCRRI
ncbi:hypothetical protein GCM10022251_60070 [Phytohabitans flavus]|uniref:DUF1579 domain-containing protein n=1 Tax=Phytohabitans flavus TaxID=1076124 RepID=A0A6F8XKP4_9ACTN|nr:DUF1579 family protein [Phytohabitans flavus]BCB74385.1 hypothetical protein Pflav_007950 [Phytohabitans flavus]